ncbi:hypothetical protein GW17_00014337, partial [Ensete ventricosum]
ITGKKRRRRRRKAEVEMGCDPELRLSLCTGEDGHRNYRSDSFKLGRYCVRSHPVDSLLLIPGFVASLNSFPARPCRVDSPPRNQQQMTIFYDGRVCVCNATEMQAKAIISMAKREMDDDTMTEKKQKQQQQQQPQQSVESSTSSLPRPPSPRAVPQMLNPGLSMKRSLQRFLQKRKARINDVSPYSQKQKLLLFPIMLQRA